MKRAVVILALNCVSVICGITFQVFLILKLFGKITWSWWWVTVPLWLSFSMVMVIVSIIVVSKVTHESPDIKNYMFDTNIFNKVLDEQLDLSSLPASTTTLLRIFNLTN